MIDEQSILDNEKLIYFTLKKLKLYHRLDEFVDIGYIGLVKGLKTYNPNSDYKESTYLIKCITNEILQEIRKSTAKKYIPKENLYSIDDKFIPDDKVNLESNLINEEKNNKLYTAISTLTFNEKYVIRHTFGLNRYEKMKNKDIAIILELKANSIARIKKRAITKLNNILNDYEKTTY